MSQALDQHCNDAIPPSYDGQPFGTSVGRKRKQSGFRVAIKKLFGRSNVKSQISLPTPTKQSHHAGLTLYLPYSTLTRNTGL